MLNLARTIESGPPMNLVEQASMTEDKWRNYLEAESHRRYLEKFRHAMHFD